MKSDPSIFKVEARAFSAQMSVPTSKSYANRILILAALEKEDVVIEDLPDSTDVLNLLKAFETIGLKVLREKNLTTIKGSFPACEKGQIDRCLVATGDGGTTTRFLIPFLALGKRLYQVEPEGGMRERPMEEMLEVLKKLQVRHNFKVEDKWLELQGPMIPAKSLTIDCQRSTQFASGFVLALGAENIDFKNLDTSEAYLEMTLKCKLKGANNFWKIPVDYSSLSYPVALAATSGRVHITNCFDVDPLQADSVLLKLLAHMGCDPEWREDGLVIQKNERLGPIQYDCSQCPDLVPTLAYLACFAKGESLLTGLEVLKYKESDRLNEISKVLSAFSVKHTQGQNFLRIIGGSAQKDFIHYHPPADHRIVMMTYLMMRTLGGGKLDQIHHVNKSFPQFFELMESHHSE